MLIFLVFVILSACGVILFSRAGLCDAGETINKDYKISVIIPARNEEKNLPNIME